MDDELYHIGVKGRSGRYPLGSGERPYQDYPHMQKRASRSIKKSRKEDLKNVRSLSDSDLTKKINRLKQEKELKDLTEKDLDPGKQQVKKVLSGAAKSTLTVVATNFLPYATARILQGKGINAADFGQYLAQKLGLKDFSPAASKAQNILKTKSDAPTTAPKKEDKKDSKSSETTSKAEEPTTSKDYKDLFDHLNGNFNIKAEDLYKSTSGDSDDGSRSKKDFDKANEWADKTISELNKWQESHKQAEYDKSKREYDKANEWADKTIDEIEDWLKKRNQNK